MFFTTDFLKTVSFTPFTAKRKRLSPWFLELAYFLVFALKFTPAKGKITLPFHLFFCSVMKKHL